MRARRTQLYFIIPIFLIAVSVLTRGKAKPMSQRPMVMGWILSPYDTKSHYKTIREHADVITHLSPTRIRIDDAEGNVASGKDNYTLSFAKKHRIAVLPLVANGDFDKDIAHAILSDPAKRAKVIDQLLIIIKRWKCPGINVDLENLNAADRPLLNAFMQELCDKFHANGLAVTIDVAAKTRDAPEAVWAGVYDYKFLGKCCDLVILMCYDEHWSGGPPGPVGSKPWIRDCLEYATSVMPREKVVLGVPFYSYDWPEEGRARSYTSKGIFKLVADKKPAIQWDNKAKSHWFEYADGDGKKRTVWYEDCDSLKHKLALAQEFGVAGISIWRLGDEDPKYWKLLARYRNGSKVLE